MTPEQWERVKLAFEVARGSSDGDRLTLLGKICADDPLVCREVESLLAVHGRAGEFIEPPSSNGRDAFVSLQPDPLVGRKLGEYTLTAVLGHGGMATVYEADQADPPRKVAVKVIRGGAGAVNPHVLRLFQREVMALARLNHPAIATIHDAGHTDDGRHYFVMEKVDGLPLNEYVRQVEKSNPGAPGRNVEIGEVLDLFVRICEGIAYAHQRGVIHRDLKPSNILVAAGDEEGTEPLSHVATKGERRSAHLLRGSVASSLRGYPKILDFGLARITDADVSVTTLNVEAGKVQGTLAYMSPEQTYGRAEDIDLRSDIYSLGVVLYELLTGRMPYEVRNTPLPLAVRAIRDDAPTRPSSAHPLLRGDLETILLKALEKEPARRYQSATALAEDVERFRRNEPILARPPSAMYQLGKLVQRHKLAATSLAVAVVLLAGFSATVSVLYGRSQSSLARALDAEQNASRQASSAKRVADFMVHLFDLTDLEESRGADITARELLERGTQALDKQLEQDPEIRVALLDAVSRAHLILGLYDRGAELRKQSLRLRERMTSTKPLDLARAQADLAWSLFTAGHEVQAIPKLREAISVYREAVPGDDPWVASSLGNLGYMLTLSTERRSAEPLLRESLEMWRRLTGAESRETAGALQFLGACYIRNKDQYPLTKAVEVLREALDIQERVLGPETRDVAETLNMLAVAESGSGDDAAVIESYHRSIAIFRKLTPFHPTLGTTLVNLGAFYTHSNPDAAEPLLQEGLTMITGSNRAQPLRNLGHVYLSRGQIRAAELLFRESVEICEASFDEGEVRTQDSQRALAQCLQAQGRDEEAETIYRTMIPVAEQVYGADHMMVSHPCYGLGQVLVKTGRPTEAEPWLRRSLEIRLHGRPPTHEEITDTRRELSECLVAQGCPDDAFEILAQRAEPTGIAGSAEEREGAASATIRFARSLRDKGRPNDAVKMLEKALTKAMSPASRISALQSLGDSYWDLGKHKESERPYREGFEIARKAFGDRDLRTHHAASGLAWSLLKQDRLDEAGALFEERLRICDEWLGPDSRESTRLLAGLGWVLRPHDGVEAAEPYFRRVLALRERHSPSGHPDLGWASLDLGECLAGQGRYEEAEPCMLASHPVIATRFGPDSNHARSVCKRIAGFYDAWGQPEQAAEWRANTSDARPAGTALSESAKLGF